MPSIYEITKVIHITTALLSISGFILRGVWMLNSSPLLLNRWVRVVPHIIDTILLVAAIILVILTAQYPGPTSWINIKIIALIAYILLGTIALKRGKTKPVRVTAWVLAILIFIYMFEVALSKTVQPW